MTIRKLLIGMAAASLITTSAFAAEMDHSAHGDLNVGIAKSKGHPAELNKLDAIPASGKAREAGSDGRYAMESTSTENDLATQCAHGSRGLVMLDNKTWSKCGGKPAGAAKGAGYYPAVEPWNKEGTGEVNKMDHSMHNMK